MPSISAASWRSVSATTACGKASAALSPRVGSCSAAAMAVAASANAVSRIAASIASFEFGQPGFQCGDAARETLDLSIASVRCSSSGRGPRRCSGPGASVRRLMRRRARWRRGVAGGAVRAGVADGDAPAARRAGPARPAGRGRQHGGRGAGPQRQHRLPGLLRLPVHRQGGQLALPQRDPVLRQLPQVGSRVALVPARAVAHASFALLRAGRTIGAPRVRAERQTALQRKKGFRNCGMDGHARQNRRRE